MNMDNEVREPEVVYGKRQFTIAEYLAYEEESSIKHEYYRGEMFAMAGGTITHNMISGNLYHLLRRELKGNRCRPFNSDQRIHITENSLFTYPDVSVVCDEIVTLNNDQINVLNPTVIIEVLSPSTRDYDRGAKFQLYRDIASLRAF